MLMLMFVGYGYGLGWRMESVSVLKLMWFDENFKVLLGFG